MFQVYFLENKSFALIHNVHSDQFLLCVVLPYFLCFSNAKKLFWLLRLRKERDTRFTRFELFSCCLLHRQNALKAFALVLLTSPNHCIYGGSPHPLLCNIDLWFNLLNKKVGFLISFSGNIHTVFRQLSS